MRKAQIGKPLGRCVRVAQLGSLGRLACEKVKVFTENIFFSFYFDGLDISIIGVIVLF